MPETCDVAIIGYGPVGATLANLLGQSGLRVVALDRETSVFHAPRAVSLDAEAMRMFQSIGLADGVAAGASAASGMRFVNAEGRLLLHWQRRGASPEGWAAVYRFHQPTLETLLREAAAELPNVQVLLGAETLAVEPDGTVTYSSAGETHTLAARWIVGCDGARSLVRKRIGGGLRELGPSERWMVLDVLLDGSHATGETVGETVQHCDPARPATYIPMVGPRRRWEFMLMPGDDVARILDPACIWEMLRPWDIGPDAARIERATVYNFNAVVARRWHAGRLLLAGDAAHQMPPFLGQGMCAGLRDAANLAWKLAGVTQGRYGPDILDTYQSERAPHVEAVIALALRLGGIIQTTDPARAAERDRAMTETPESLRVELPRLGPGLHDPADALAGSRAAQPLLSDGTRLDDQLGNHFGVLATPTLLAQAHATTSAMWRRAEARIVPATGEAAAWLASLGREAVIIRPDRAILATASTPDDLDRASRLLPDAGDLACTSSRSAISA